MDGYKHILVPIDGSGPSTQGLNEAIRVAVGQGNHIRLIHVLNRAPLASPDITGSRFDKLFGQLRDEGLRLLSAAEASVRKAGIAVDVRLIEATGGSPGECIVEQALEWPADLIVCGTHGRRGLLRVLMGSDAEHILRRSPVPVLLVPAHAGGHARRVAAES
jgi:nucleotide-binding universal stress UspA family protein